VASTDAFADGESEGRRQRPRIEAGRRFLAGLFQSPLRPMPVHWKRWLVILLVLSALPRVAVWFAVEPYWYGDTPRYVATAHMFLGDSTPDYDATIAPGYPAFIALFAGYLGAVQAAQLLLGLLTTALLFWMALRLTGSLVAALVSGAMYSFSMVQVGFETTILTEALSTALVVAAMSLVVALTLGKGGFTRTKQLGLGLVSAAAVAARPALALVPLVALLAVLSSRKAMLKVAMSVLLPSVVFMLGWSAFNYATLGSFTPSSLGGIALYTHVKDMVENDPEGYPDIADIRQDLALANGYPANEWQIAVEMAKREGRSVPEASSEMLGLSARLIVKHPAHYARGVVLGSAWFWRGPDPKYRHGNDSHGIVSAAWYAQKATMFAGTGMIFCLSLVVVAFRLRSVARTPRGRAWVALAAVIVLSCILQAMTQFGANARYGVPFQPIWTLCAVVFLHEAMVSWRSRKSASPSSPEAV
jgi:hypothetical protein